MFISSIFYIKGKKNSTKKLTEESALGMHVLYEHFCQQNNVAEPSFNIDSSIYFEVIIEV